MRGAFTVKKKTKYAKNAPEGDEEVMTEEIAGEFMKMSKERRGTMSM